MRKSALLIAFLLLLTACGGFFGPRDDNTGTGTTGKPKFLYAANFGGGVGVGTISGFTVNTSSGALTPISTGPFNAGTGPDHARGAAAAPEQSGRGECHLGRSQYRQRPLRPCRQQWLLLEG